MPDPADSRRQNSAAIDATIEHNAERVRRGRKSRDRSFLKRLGLSLPVTVEDVKQAYYVRARETHPDRKGDSREFKEVQEAFDAALKYAETNGKRLPWLSAQAPLYAAQQRLVEMVEAWGGSVEIQQLTWLEDTVGEDFAQLADRLCAIDLTGAQVGDVELVELFSEPDGLKYLDTLSLANTRVTDDAILEVMKASQLRRLDLRGTQVSHGMRRQIAKLPRFDKVLGTKRWGGLLGG